jgi:hypothetical protein
MLPLNLCNLSVILRAKLLYSVCLVQMQQEIVFALVVLLDNDLAVTILLELSDIVCNRKQSLLG